MKYIYIMQYNIHRIIRFTVTNSQLKDDGKKAVDRSFFSRWGNNTLVQVLMLISNGSFYVDRKKWRKHHYMSTLPVTIIDAASDN